MGFMGFCMLFLTNIRSLGLWRLKVSGFGVQGFQLRGV